uniref:Uncharacterized protein n=1 Tax=Anguilla anguilla TaxID=7936 RepID=A0A0E9UQL1_ANGAN
MAIHSQFTYCNSRLFLLIFDTLCLTLVQGVALFLFIYYFFLSEGAVQYVPVEQFSSLVKNGQNKQCVFQEKKAL